MSWFKPLEGARYRKDEVVQRCLSYIHSPGFSGNVAEKEQKVALIEAMPGEIIEFRSRGKGFGELGVEPELLDFGSRGLRPPAA